MGKTALKIIIFILYLIVCAWSSAHATIISGPVSGQPFDLIDQSLYIDPGSSLIISHNDNVGLFNTSILGGEGASLFIQTTGNIFIDQHSLIVIPNGEINLMSTGGSINLQGDLETEVALIAIDPVTREPLDENIGISSDLFISIQASGILSTTGGVINLSPRDHINISELAIEFIIVPGDINISAVPIPPAILLFITALCALLFGTRPFTSSKAL